MFGKGHAVSDLEFPPRLGTKVRCIVVPDGKVWTNGQIGKNLIVPRVGVIYSVRGNVRSSQQFPLPIAVGILLQEVVNDLIEIRKGMKIEPFFLRGCFRLAGA